jgi:hypothetical protein
MSQIVAPTSLAQAPPARLAPSPDPLPLPPAAPPPPVDRIEGSCDCCGCFALVLRCASFILELCGQALAAVGSFFRELFLCCCNPRAYRECQQVRAYIDWLNAGEEVRPQQEILERLRTLPRRAILALRNAIEHEHMEAVRQGRASYIRGIINDLGTRRELSREEHKAPRPGDEPPREPALPSQDQLFRRHDELIRQAITQFLSENPAHPFVIRTLEQFIEAPVAVRPRAHPQRMALPQNTPLQPTRPGQGAPGRFVSRDENKEQQRELWGVPSWQPPRQNMPPLPSRPRGATAARSAERPRDLSKTGPTVPAPAALQQVPGQNRLPQPPVEDRPGRSVQPSGALNRTPEVAPEPAVPRQVPWQTRPPRLDAELVPFTQYLPIAHPPGSEAVPAHLD